jgi:hypothetical protein
MIRRLLYLNGLAVLGVILFHASGMGFVAMFAWTHRYLPVTAPNYDQMGSAAYYGLRVIEAIVTFSIPAFSVYLRIFHSFCYRPDPIQSELGIRLQPHQILDCPLQHLVFGYTVAVNG